MARIRGAFNFCDCDCYATLSRLIGFSLFSHSTSRCHTASSRQLTHSLTHPPTNLNSFTYEIVGLSRARLQLTRFSSIRYFLFLIWFISIKSFKFFILFCFCLVTQLQQQQQHQHHQERENNAVSNVLLYQAPPIPLKLSRPQKSTSNCQQRALPSTTGTVPFALSFFF